MCKLFFKYAFFVFLIFLQKPLDKHFVLWYYIYVADSKHLKNGEMSERFKEPVLKTGDSREGAVGSNPTLSAILSA